MILAILGDFAYDDVFSFWGVGVYILAAKKAVSFQPGTKGDP